MQSKGWAFVYFQTDPDGSKEAFNDADIELRLSKAPNIASTLQFQKVGGGTHQLMPVTIIWKKKVTI